MVIILPVKKKTYLVPGTSSSGGGVVSTVVSTVGMNTAGTLSSIWYYFLW